MSSQTYPVVKVVLLGNSGVGKTSLIQKLINRQTIQSYKPTVGTDFSYRTIQVKNQKFTLMLWDTAGQERFVSLGTSFYRGADACIIVFDVTNRKSFEQVLDWKGRFQEHGMPKNDKIFPYILVGNKADQRIKGKDLTRRAKELIQHGYFSKYMETSVIDGRNVERLLQYLAQSSLDYAKETKKIEEESAGIQLQEQESQVQKKKSSCC